MPHVQDLIESCLANKASARPSSAEVLAKVDALLEALAAGTLNAPLAQQPATIASKLFRLDSTKPAKDNGAAPPQARSQLHAVVLAVIWK